jgi:hypothetical protein
VSHVVLPIDQREQGLFCPLPPYGGAFCSRFLKNDGTTAYKR